MEDFVRSRQREGVAVVEMHRPRHRNAMDTALLRRLLAVLRALAEDDGVAAVVLAGAGGAFSAGADVGEPLDRPGARQRMGLFCDLYELVTAYPRPTVAAVHGSCVGGGAEVAAACDLRVGTPASRVRFPGAHFGIPAGCARLPLLVGLSHAKDLLMTARTVQAEEAHRIGFLNRLVSEEALEDAAVGLAAEMATNPGALLQKRLLDEMAGLGDRVGRENRGLRRWQAAARGLMG